MYQQLILLAPCHGLEDFPMYHTGEDAESLLACWTSLWHPALIHAAGRLPQIERCDYPPESLQNALLLLPLPCEAELNSELPDRATSQNATLVRGLSKRPQILEQAFAPWDNAPHIDTELVRDFFAFGFAFLQVELLTQQMRYASSIDQSRIKTTLLDAAKAAVENDHDTVRERLTSGFDALSDERNHYYPVEVYLLDLTMLASVESTLGGALKNQLQDTTPQNFLANGRTIDELSRHHHSSLGPLKTAIHENRASIAGGEYDEFELPLMTYDSALRQIEKGRASYGEHLDAQPVAFARRRHGIFPGLAQLIRNAGFDGALHLKFDEGQLPSATQCKTRWDAGGDETIDAYARPGLDASLHETFLNLPSQLSDSMDMDHVATRAFIHWPGRVAPWYNDLRRGTRFGSAIGKFVTLKEYFELTGDGGNNDTFSASGYKYPYFKQAVSRGELDPISKWMRYWHHTVATMVARTNAFLAGSLCNEAAAKSDASDWELLLSRVDERVTTDADVSQACAEANAKSSQAIAGQICKPNPNAITILNPTSFARRFLVDTTNIGAVATGSAVYASHGEPDGRTWTLVDVPSLGFASVVGGGTNTIAGPDLAHDLTLSNEFVQATIDPITGALRSLKDYRSRSTLLSQQLALRIAMPKTGQPWIDRQTPAAYSVMAADSVAVTRNGKIMAEITSQGRLLDLNGESLGEFTQRYKLRRGSRWMELEIELVPASELIDDPWDSYYGCRFAWADETAMIRVGQRMQTFETSLKRFEAPLFVDIDTGKQHTTIFTGGIPYHRRLAGNRIDTPLIVKGEQARTFRFGLGIDVPQMTRGAFDFLAADPITIPGETKSGTGWLFHLDAKNVIATHWALQPQVASEGKCMRMRLLETEGRTAKARLRGFVPFQSAAIVDITGNVVRDLTIVDGVVQFTLKAHEFAELRVLW